MRVNKELLKGSTTMLVLKLLENEDLYGYLLVKKLSEKSENIFQLKEGTLYPILHSLESKGIIDSYWDETSSKKRKYYSITNKGRKVLKEKKDEWEVFCRGVNTVIGGVTFAN